MRKFYSIVLMAAALLIGTNVSAAKIAEMTIGGVTTDVENLWDEFRDLPANTTATFKMVADAEIVPGTGAASNNAAALWVNAGQNITLDLNGHTINSAARFNFGHASFTLTGQGIYNCSVSQALNCYGSEDTSVPYGWSAITIGKDVTLNDPAGYAIGILYASLRPDGPTSGNQRYYSCGVQVDVYGQLISKYGVASNGTMAYNVGNIPVLNIHPSALVQGDNTLTEMVGDASLYSDSDDKAVANAIVACADAPTYTEGQYVGKKYYKTTNAGLYCAGYMHYNIKGTVTGGVGVYVKAGDVNIDNATIMATSAEMWTPIKYGNGFIGAGSAIIFDSNSSYSAEGMSIDVTGDSYVSSTSGYAIQDLITSGQEKMEANDVNIESGTFVGATVTNPETGLPETLCINFTDDLGEDIKQTGSISGGTFNSTDVQEYIHTSGDGIIVPVETATGTVYVVAEKPSGTSWVADLNAAAADAYVKLDAAGSTILSADKNIDYLNIAAAHTVIIPDGKTLTVGEIVLGDNAVIDVKAGGKLIVDGANGIIAFNANNLKIETSETAQAIFLLSPAVKSNRHPNATVEFTSRSYRLADGSRFVWQRFGIPTHEALKNITIENDIPTAFGALNYETGNWEVLGYLNQGGTDILPSALNNSFGFYQMLHNTPNIGTKVTMEGELVGNVDPSLDIEGNTWCGFANSYMATVNGEQLLGMIPDGVEQSFQVYQVTEHQAVWTASSFLDCVNIEPMQPFLMYNPGAAAKMSLKYKEAVYAPATKANAPARSRALNNITKAKLVVKGENSIDRVVVAEGANFSAEFDNGYDASKYMNEGINMYVSADEKMAIFATDNLENTYVGFQTVSGGNYTIEFTNVQGNELTLIDHVAGARVAMVEGATYEFTADANSANDYRFEIVGRQNMPTAIDNTEAVKSVKGVYTITGQYVGEMNVWNTLPAGVYVVNGEKRVK